ncbi:efflux RND transporter periplasmic adaptor subunit [Oceanisphaera psychrotolerans]|uniref:Secretion protein HylD n=1 Tax=Oceanisphaera psychrotolerans TaxID=1414654 RepID=A0A1J4QCQ9_9GAMM|nr:HlyD family secretion protein [Oceanisphaera psychrotolerans]OIN05613.1 hypothetical protein BFR47_05375 [Oceanisphaera psychrotolerans]
MNASITLPVSAEQTLATLLQLSRRARQCDKAAELRFLLVNETQALVPFRQSAFWSRDQGVAALSGVTAVEQHAPYVQWLMRWCGQGEDASESGAFATDLRALAGKDPDWAEWLPPFLATVELPGGGRFNGGRLVLARDTPFNSAELALLQEWAEAWSARYAIVQPVSWRGRWRTRGASSATRRWLIRLGAVAVTLLIGMLPVRLTVLAPAELIPLDPAIVRAPLDGIVDRVLVTPNQRVTERQPLFEFDRVSLASRLEVAGRQLVTQQAEYRRNAQRALFDPDSKAELAVLQSQIDQQQVEVEYLRELNRRSEVLSPRAGIVLLDDASDWVGRPVVTGERVLVVADETQTQLEAWLSPADMIALPAEAPVTLYLVSDPLTPLGARVEYVAHEPELRPEGHYAYRVRARLVVEDEAQPGPRVGLKGTAKLEGERVSLAYWILRRPWAALRAWIGL